MTPTTAALVLAWICVVLLALATAGLLRRVEALERGGAATPTAAPRRGLVLPLERHLGGGLGGDRDVLLLLVTPTCRSCQAAVDTLASAPPPADVVVATAAADLGPLAVPAAFRTLAGATGLVDLLDVPATPYLVRLGGDGTVLGGDLVTAGTDLAAVLGAASTGTAPQQAGGRR